jgi:hypothetical protein
MDDLSGIATRLVLSLRFLLGIDITCIDMVETAPMFLPDSFVEVN